MLEFNLIRGWLGLQGTVNKRGNSYAQSTVHEQSALTTILVWAFQRHIMNISVQLDKKNGGIESPTGPKEIPIKRTQKLVLGGNPKQREKR